MVKFVYIFFRYLFHYFQDYSNVFLVHIKMYDENYASQYVLQLESMNEKSVRAHAYPYRCS